VIGWRQIEVIYDEKTVLGPLDLVVADGEWLGLIGPNGAGKSSLLKAGAGIVPYRGTVDLEGSRARAGIDIAWMPQRPHLPDEMSVVNYVLLGRTPHVGYWGSESRADVAAVEKAIGRLNLDDLASRPLATLSGGEAQRAVLARALAQEAPVLLLDEPTSSLDIGHAIDVLEIVDDLRIQDGLTVVTAIHDLTLAGRFAARLVMLSGGSIVAAGSPESVLTEEVLEPHYGAGVRVIRNGDGVSVIPTRIQRD
jgi:cobalamin transport system ATP-binding protein